MKRFIGLIVATGALALAAPAFAQDPAVSPGYISGAPAYSSPDYASGPLGVIAMPFRIAAAPFEMFVPANGAAGPSPGSLVPAAPDCGVWHDWNGRYTALCGL